MSQNIGPGEKGAPAHALTFAFLHPDSIRRASAYDGPRRGVTCTLTQRLLHSPRSGSLQGRAYEGISVLQQCHTKECKFVQKRTMMFTEVR